MKIQDIIFIISLIFIIYKNNSKLTIILGLVTISMAIPLFAKWIFFTAERFTWYAAAFFLLAIVQIIKKK